MGTNQQEDAFEQLIPLVRKAAAHAKIPEAQATELVAFLATYKFIRGKVSEITAFETFTSKTITDKDGKSEFFFFPPNDEKFNKQIERAQNNGLEVTVGYREENGIRTISSVTVHGKE